MLSVRTDGLRRPPQRPAEGGAGQRPGRGQRGPGDRRRGHCLQQRREAAHLQAARARPPAPLPGAGGRPGGHGTYPYDYSGERPEKPEQPPLCRQDGRRPVCPGPQRRAVQRPGPAQGEKAAGDQHRDGQLCGGAAAGTAGSPHAGQPERDG